MCFFLFTKYPKYFMIENIIKQSKKHKMLQKSNSQISSQLKYDKILNNRRLRIQGTESSSGTRLTTKNLF